jgi:hypothetical protein
MGILGNIAFFGFLYTSHVYESPEIRVSEIERCELKREGNYWDHELAGYFGVRWISIRSIGMVGHVPLHK